MYTSSLKTRFRHIDVAIIDLICLNIAFILAYELRIGGENPYLVSLYRDLLIVVSLSSMLVANLLGSYADIEKRGYYKEFVALAKQGIIAFLLGVLYLYSVMDAHKFSRLTMFIMGCIFFAADYISRIIWKKIKFKKRKITPDKALLIISDSINAEKTIRSIETDPEMSVAIKGIVLTDDPGITDIGRYPVVCSLNDVSAYVCHNWVDDVLIVLNDMESISKETLRELSETGVIAHIGLRLTDGMLGSRQFVETFGGYNVLTSCMNEASALDVFLKRVLDIFAGIVGCIITGIVYLFIAPIIRSQSPGPVFFKQQRVGRNGRVFSMVKFRSMYMDAEEKKKELVAANRVSDGMMFKLDFDPRIIGNEILPDGTKKTGIGDFIRRTSIDELPQFYNVLKGEMSLVGTRPPTLDEWEKYAPHHRARLAIKPGITGMWQVSGRSEITDFEEVVALDTKYINEWSLGLDIKIILKTFAVVFKKDGAM